MLRSQWPLSDDHYYTLKRYEAFQAAAEYVARAFEGQPSVRRVALFGSVASTPTVETSRRRNVHLHEPKDTDLAVWLDPVTGLNELRKLSANVLQRLWQEKELGVAHHQVDIFLFDATGTYIGRLCHFNECPKHKPECRVHRCGRSRAGGCAARSGGEIPSRVASSCTAGRGARSPSTET
jgi:hypothetical protein